MSRPFFNWRIQDLEVGLAERRDDIEFLQALIHELDFRSTDRASRLKAQATEALARTQGPPPPSPGAVETSARPSPPPREPVRPILSEISGERPPVPRVTNAPQAILDAWTALEVLSPQSFRRPEELTGGERQAIASLDQGRLPWEGGGEKSRPKMRLFYQLVLGTVDLEKATARLLTVYSDFRVERPQMRGEAILAVVLLDKEGRLVEAPAVSVSSFGWGVPRALQSDLSSLAGWRVAEKPLVEGLDEILRRAQDEEEDPPLDLATIRAGYEWLVASLGLPPELVTPPKFAIRDFQSYKNPDPPDPYLLNSFYLNDLTAAKTRFAEGKETPNLRLYLGCDIPATRLDLLENTAVLEAAVAPERIPPARWPGPGRHPLVLLQQAAVNLALQELRNTGILAVNGPPGTGKTTLLRDLVAAIVTERAEAMAGFDDPASAFLHSGEKLKVGQGWRHLYRLDPRLKGFEMLAASSNNKVVENVSAELPELKRIAEDAADLRYLKTLSDGLRESETWGLVAAVLGNAVNRNRFKQTFWWDEDLGLSTYLAEAAGTPQSIEEIDPGTGERKTRPPRIVSGENPPHGPGDAFRRWQQARSAFRKALEKSRNTLAVLARIREMAAMLPGLAREEADATDALRTAEETVARARDAADHAQGRLTEVQREGKETEKKLSEHDRTRPGFFARLFNTRRARDWRSTRAPLAAAHERAKEEISLASGALAMTEKALREAVTRQETAERNWAPAAERHAEARRRVSTARERLGKRFIDADFFARDHADRHQTAPWLDAEHQRARDDVFVAAMALHKAFVDAAAKPLRHNLGVLMNTFGGRSLPTAEKRALIPDLWASLFLVVPLVSTTFASVERMLGDLPAEGIGWLFIDEAGQALPQAAVGALLRSRRAVVVGDPVQIEPIVSLPETLTQAICRHFGVDPDRYNAPNASAQTLADAATPYMAEFQGKHGSRTVGVPLLVHRRCAEPMFGISNAVAYERLMVQAKAAAPSRIGEILGPSAWIDVRGGAAEKWCQEEGEMVLSLLRRLAAAEIVPDLYIVTPFVIVADNLRKLVRESGVLADWTEDPWRWTSERIGTVHTVQGREAEAVIFVLGAPAPQQTGARGWAGGRPNLLNVAVTRAKERLYVIGNRHLWREAGLFRELNARLPEAMS